MMQTAKISLASKVLQDQTPVEVIRIAAELGYGGIEWFCLPQHLPPETSASGAKALAARTRAAGLVAVCLSTYVGGFAESADETCAAQLALLERYLQLAGVLECTVLRVWPDLLGRTLREPVRDDLLMRAADYLRTGADRAAAYGMTLAIEMHLTIGADVELVERMLNLIERPNVGVIYDPGNVYLARLPYGVGTIRRLAGRIRHVQFKDVSLQRPTPPHLINEPTLRHGGDFDLLLGEGELDFAPLVAALREIGYSGWYSVECHALPRPGMDSAAIAAAELASMRNLLAPSNSRK